MLTPAQLIRWLDYYLHQFGKAMRSSNHAYREICGRRLRTIRALQRASAEARRAIRRIEER